MTSFETKMTNVFSIWRPGITQGVIQRQAAFKLITLHAKSRTTKSIPGLYN